MIHELVVTSAARGLQAGRSGFTTVLRTRGIHPELQAKLEQGSAYRHVYPQGDGRNPRILSHALLHSPAGQLSVLSSIVDAGNGYDGRSNKLAHHLALDGGEVSARSTSSPAAVLAALDRGGGFMRRWSGQPREQDGPTHAPPAPSCEPKACSAWARAAGDAGWAGFIVERALRRQQTWIVAPPDCDLIELFAEALALVPPAQRWGVTFTTYAVGQPDVLWLGTMDGAPEAQAALGQTRVAVVDLVRKPAFTASSVLVDAARGKSQVSWLAEPAERVAGATATAAPSAAPGKPPRIAGRPGAPPPLANPFAFSATIERQPRANGAGTDRPERARQRSWRPVILAVVATVGIVAVIALALFVVAPQLMGSGGDGRPLRSNSRGPGSSGDAQKPKKTVRTEVAGERGGGVPPTAVPTFAPETSRSLDRRPQVVGRSDPPSEPSPRATAGQPIDRGPVPVEPASEDKLDVPPPER